MPFTEKEWKDLKLKVYRKCLKKAKKEGTMSPYDEGFQDGLRDDYDNPYDPIFEEIDHEDYNAGFDDGLACKEDD